MRFVRTADLPRNGGAFDAVRESLETATAERSRIREQVAAVKGRRKAQPRVPNESEVLKLVLDLEARFCDDPTATHEALRHMLGGGSLTMLPQEDGSYRAESVIPLNLAWKSRKPRNPEGTEALREVVEIDGCAGKI